MTGRRGPAAEEARLLALPPRRPQRTLRYGPHPSHVIDYHLPAGPCTARVTVLHGGFWREAYDRTHLSATAAALADRGLAVALAEYRRVGGGGGWPQTFEDVCAVVDTAWAPGPGGPEPDFEARGAVLLGHSAGGHLALWAASRGARLPGADSRPGGCREAIIRRVVALAPVADLAYAHELGLSSGAVGELLGGAAAVGPALPHTDPMRLLPPGAPAVILHGTADPDVPVEVSRRYAAAARRSGGAVSLRELEGRGHYAPLIPATPEFELLVRALSGDGLRAP